MSERGFAALGLSILGARRVFGSSTYTVCLNSMPLDSARTRLGKTADLVGWHLSEGLIPAFLRDRMGDSLAEGVAWKFAPMRLDPSRYEISLDNDCVLWAMPAAIGQWLREEPRDRALPPRGGRDAMLRLVRAALRA